MFKKSFAETPSADTRSKDTTIRNIKLALSPTNTTNIKDGTVRSKSKFNQPNEYMLGVPENDVFKRASNKFLVDSLESNSLDASPLRIDRQRDSTSQITKYHDLKVNLIFAPPTLLQASPSAQGNFHSFGKLVTTHRDEINKIDPDLIGEYQTRSELEKQLDFNKAQEKRIKQRMQEISKEKFKTFNKNRKEQVKKEQKMPIVRMYPSRHLQAQHAQQVTASDESLNDDSDGDGSKDQEKRAERKIQASENIKSILTKQVKFFKYRSFDTLEWRPEGREAGTFVTNGRFAYLFGGMSQNTIPYMEVLDTLKWTWTKVEPKGDLPEGRLGHSACYYQNRVIIFGGEKKYNTHLRLRECLNDVYSFSTDSQTWSRMRCFGDLMEPRRNHTAAIVGDHMLVYGGITTYGEFLSDLKALSFATMKWVPCFEEANPDVGIAFHASALVLHPKHKKFSLYKSKQINDPPLPHIKEEGLYVFGGKDECGAVLNTLRILKVGQKPLKWIVPETIGQPPAPRIQHTMSHYEGLNCIIIYGGRNDHTGFLGDIAVLYLENLSWMGVSIQGNPSTLRFSHGAAVVGTKLCVFGGLNFQGYVSSDVEVLELDQANVVERIKDKNDLLVKKDYLLPDIVKRVQYQDSIEQAIPNRTAEVRGGAGSPSVKTFLPLPTKEELKRPSLTDLDDETMTPSNKKFIRRNHNHKKLYPNLSTAIGHALAHIPKSFLESFNPKRLEKKSGANTAR